MSNNPPVLLFVCQGVIHSYIYINNMRQQANLPYYKLVEMQQNQQEY